MSAAAIERVSQQVGACPTGEGTHKPYVQLQTLCSIYRKMRRFQAVYLQTLCSITNPMLNYKPYVQYIALQTLCSIDRKTRVSQNTLRIR